MKRHFLYPNPIKAVTFITATNEVDSGSATSLALTIPAGLLVGDFVVAFAAKSTTNAHSWSAGWTMFDDGTSFPKFSLAYRFLTGSDPNPTFNMGVTAGRVAGFMSAFRNVNTGTPVTSNGGFDQQTSSTATSSFGGVGVGAMVAYFGAQTTLTTAPVLVKDATCDQRFEFHLASRPSLFLQTRSPNAIVNVSLSTSANCDITQCFMGIQHA